MRRRTRAPGIVSVTRSTNGSSAGAAATASRSRTSSAGAPGKSDAVCPSGPRPSRTRSSGCVPERGVVGGGRLGGRRARVSIGCTSRRDDEPLEQRLADEQLVRAGIVGGDAAVVAEPDLDAAPVGVRLPLRARRRGGASSLRPGRSSRPRARGLDEQRGGRGRSRLCVRPTTTSSTSIAAILRSHRAQVRAQPRNAASSSAFVSSDRSSASTRPTTAIVVRIWST